MRSTRMRLLHDGNATVRLVYIALAPDAHAPSASATLSTDQVLAHNSTLTQTLILILLIHDAATALVTCRCAT